MRALLFVGFCFVMVHDAAAQRVRPTNSSSIITPPGTPVVIIPQMRTALIEAQIQATSARVLLLNGIFVSRYATVAQ